MLRWRRRLTKRTCAPDVDEAHGSWNDRHDNRQSWYGAEESGFVFEGGLCTVDVLIYVNFVEAHKLERTMLFAQIV